MATFSERLAYILDFDTKGAIRDVEKFGKAAERELGKADDKLDRLGRGMQTFGLGAVAFAGTAALGLVALASGAADAEAGMAALEQVVGEAVAHDIGKWAEGSAKNVGLSSRAAVDAATNFAQLGKIIGLGGQDLAGFSTKLVTLAADFAAFKNVSPEQAIQDISAAFAGSTEVMRKYGIFLDDNTLKQAYFRETGEKVKGTLSAEQKILAINAELYRQGADMIGQWSRESGEFAGVQAQLKANLQNLADSIGAGVLPMVSGLVSWLNQGAEALNRLSPGAKSAIGTFAGIGVAVLGAAGALSFVIGKVITARDRFAQLGRALRTSEGNLTRMGRVATVASVGMGALAVATLIMSLRAQQAAQHAQQFSNVVDGLARANDEQLESFTGIIGALSRLRDKKPEEVFADIARENLGAAMKVRDHAAANDEFRAKMESVGLTVDEMTGILNDEAAAQKRAQEAAEASSEAVERAGQATESATAKTIPYVDWLEQRGSAEQRASDNAYELARAEEEAEEALDALIEAQEEGAEAAETEAEAHRDNAEAILETVSARRAAADAQFALNDAVRGAQDEIATYNEMVKEGKSSMAELGAQQDKVAQSAGDVADAQIRIAEETAAANGQTLTAVEKGDIWRKSMLEQAAAVDGPLRDAILGYIANVEGIPESRLSEIKAAIAGGDLQKARDLLDSASETRSAEIKADAQTKAAEQDLETTRRKKRIAEILAEANDRAADDKLTGTAKKRRVAELVAEALTSKANSDLNLTAKEREAIVRAIARGDAGTVIDRWARARSTTITVYPRKGGGISWSTPGGIFSMYDQGGRTTAMPVSIAGERGFEFTGDGVVTAPTVIPPGVDVTSTRKSRDLVEELTKAVGALTAAVARLGQGSRLVMPVPQLVQEIRRYERAQ